MLQQPNQHSNGIHQTYQFSDQDITPERLKLKQLKTRVAITPRPIPHPIFFNQAHEHPQFNNEFVQFVPYQQEYLMEPYRLDPYAIPIPNTDHMYASHHQPFNIHSHHDHDLVIQTNPPLKHQLIIDDQFEIDQQFQSAFPIDCVSGVNQVLGKDDMYSEKESNLNITIVNRPLSLDPQLNTPFKKFISKEHDTKRGESVILIEDESEVSESENESEASSIKLHDPSFVMEPGKIYVIDDSDDEHTSSSNEQENQSENQEEQEEKEEPTDEESFHLISENNSIIHEPTLPTQPSSPEHIKSSLEVDLNNAKTNLYHWSFLFEYKPKDELTVSILGKTNIDGNRNFTTSPIVHRISSNTVLTLNGTKYILTSTFDTLRNKENNTHISEDFLKHFINCLDGPFPKNWRELVEKEFKRLEEPNPVIENHTVETSNNFQNENNFDYQIGGLDETNTSIQQDDIIEESTKKKPRKSKTRVFEGDSIVPQKPLKISKKRRKKYDTSSDEDENDEEYADPSLTEKKKRKSVQTSILNSFTKDTEKSITLTDELKSAMLSWKRRTPHSLSPPKIPLETFRELEHRNSPKMTENDDINQELTYDNRIEHQNFNDNYFNEIGGFSPEEDEIKDDIPLEEPKKKRKQKSKRKLSRKSTSLSTSNSVEQDLDLSLPKVVIPTSFPKTSQYKKGKKKEVSLERLQMVWFGNLEE